MSHDLHGLQDEFPQAIPALHALKLGNPHFKRLAESYAGINHEINRIEAQLEAVSDERAEALKKQRLAILDEIATLVNGVGAA